jgi:hypothetical protein
MFCGPKLILPPQPPVVLNFDLWRADGKWREGGVIVRLVGYQLNSSAPSIVCNILRFHTQKLI